MVIVKTLQSLLEVRFGYAPHARWFASRLDELAAAQDAQQGAPGGDGPSPEKP